MDILQGAVPVDQFEAAETAQPAIAQAPSSMPQEAPEGAIPVDQFETHEKSYGGVGQGVQAGLEGALRGAISAPGAALVEKHLGLASPAGILGRQTEHPVASAVGEASTLIGGAVTGVGEGALLGKAGELASAAAGLEGATSLGAKIGSSVVKQAAEMAVYQSGDEVAKQILDDPEASAQSAIANIGLASALGAGAGFITGAASPLWKATLGPKLESGLKAISDHLGGVEGQAGKSTANEIANMTGVEVPREIIPVINDVPGAMNAHSYLSQNDTSFAGRAYQKKLNEYESSLAAKSIESLGQEPRAIEKLGELDKYASGRAQGETLSKELRSMTKPVTDAYNTFNEEAKNTLLSVDRKRAIADQISQKAITEGWNKASDEGSQKLAQNIVSSLDKQETVQDLKKFITNLRESHPFGKETYHTAKDLGKILQENLSDSIAENIVRAGGSSAEAAEKAAAYGQLRKGYAKVMDHIDNLNEHLHVGRYEGPESFFKALDEHATQHGERLLNQLSGKNSANILELLKATPETLNLVKQHHVDKLLSEAVQKAPAGKAINANHIVSTLFDPKKTSPQIRDLMAGPQQQQILSGIGKALEALKDPTHNFSNTARTLAKEAHGAISPLSLLAMLAGHGQASLMSFLGSLGIREVTPAAKLAMMRFLSSDAPIKAEGFKSMVNMVESAYKSDKTMLRASKNMFLPGIKVLTDSQIPSVKELEKLDRMVAKNSEDSNEFLDNQKNSHIGHYLPQHQQALTESTARATQYLAQLKPKPVRPNPLDKEIPPSKEQEARYHRALEIAQQPLMVIQKIKDGTIQASDVQDLKAMYPAVYSQVSQKLTNELMNRQSDEQATPYKSRIGLSLFLGQPLDTTMAPMSIIAAQPVKAQPQQREAQGKTKRGTSTLGKHNSMYQTPGQAAEADRSGRD